MSNIRKPHSGVSTIQSLLVENGQLIETIAGFQRIGKYDDVPRYMELLYKNILYLSKLGDPELAAQLSQESGLNNVVTSHQQHQLPSTQPLTTTTFLQQQQQLIAQQQQLHSRIVAGNHQYLPETPQQPLQQNGGLPSVVVPSTSYLPTPHQGLLPSTSINAPQPGLIMHLPPTQQQIPMQHYMVPFNPPEGVHNQQQPPIHPSLYASAQQSVPPQTH